MFADIYDWMVDNFVFFWLIVSILFFYAMNYDPHSHIHPNNDRKRISCLEKRIDILFERANYKKKRSTTGCNELKKNKEEIKIKSLNGKSL